MLQIECCGLGCWVKQPIQTKENAFPVDSATAQDFLERLFYQCGWVCAMQQQNFDEAANGSTFSLRQAIAACVLAQMVQCCQNFFASIIFI